MEYFNDIIQKITKNGEEFFNLTRFFNVSGFVKNIHLQDYIVKDGDTFDTIAYKIYGNVDYWWLVALVTAKKDLFNNIPLSDKVLKKHFSVLIQKGLKNDNEHDWLKMKEENEQKRKIKVLKPQYLQQLIYLIQKAINSEAE